MVDTSGAAPDPADVEVRDSAGEGESAPSQTARPTASTASDGSFDAFLKEAAHVSSPVATHRASLRAGTILSGGRLVIVSRLGEGGMGVVYEAFDAERKTRVALKTLTRLDAAGVYRLKSEFRTLADVTHPNLVSLYELFAERDDWFFTMELVDGERFDRWVRPDRELDERRLRAALAQLVAAVNAIHEAGKLHRDLKPSNVLVTSEGRVVVLDFGLAVDVDVGGTSQSLEDTVSGTPAYMAPEQAAGHAPTVAADHYALGVMLFEALTGKLPFTGRVHRILEDKQQLPAPAVTQYSPAAQHDLSSLCQALLSRDPADRPDGAALRASLGEPARVAAPVSRRLTSTVEPLIGRDAELAELRAAYEAMRLGQAVVMFVSGESGMGKSALCRHFLRAVRTGGGGAVFSARCYERENVPFKAFDELIDDVSRYLRSLPGEDAAALLPTEIFAVARLFPVLDRVQVVARAPKHSIPDPQELQRRGFAALCELLTRIRAREPLVLFVDDLQWTDRDSTALLRHVLESPDPVPALIILSHRSEGADQNELLQEILRWAQGNPRLATRRLTVAPLPVKASSELALSLLRRSNRAAPDLATKIAEEAGGNPFFVGELAHHAAREDAEELSSVSLRFVVGRRIDGLPPAARELLEVLATASWPMPIDVAADAAGLESEPQAAVDVLRTEKLLRSTGDSGTRRFECYHDRIRETVASQLSADALRHCHLRLEAALRKRSDANPELLFLHAERAGLLQQAAHDAVRAAECAIGKLAFERAAHLWTRALELGTFDGDRRRGLLTMLGDALMGAGRGAEAAEAYLRAAQGAQQLQSIDLKRRAAERLFGSGHLDRGVRLLHETLRELCIPIATTTSGALVSAIWQRFRLGIRGLKFVERPEGAVDTAELIRLDALYACAMCLSWVNPVRAAGYQMRHIRATLDCGEPTRVVGALGLEAMFGEVMGAPRSRADGILEQADNMARRLSSPAALASLERSRTAVLFLRVDPANVQVAERAIALTRDLGQLASADMGMVRNFHLTELFSRGAFKRLSEVARSLKAEAEQRGDNLTMITLSKGVEHTAWLVDGDAEHAELLLARGRELWPSSECCLVSLYMLFAEAWLAHYRDQPTSAWACLEREEEAIKASGLLQMPINKVALAFTRGTTAAWLVRSANRAPAIAHRKLLRVAERDASSMRRMPPGLEHWRYALQAAVCLARSERDRAAETLQALIAYADARPAAMYAAAARRRLGELLGGPSGAELIAAGEAAMRAQTIADPEAMTRRLLPGCHVE